MDYSQCLQACRKVFLRQCLAQGIVSAERMVLQSVVSTAVKEHSKRKSARRAFVLATTRQLQLEMSA